MQHFFIGCTHFGHANIIKYCNRPFANAEAMDETMIKNWNLAVAKNDIVFHLGDCSFGKPPDIVATLQELNGTINIVPGSHDTTLVRHRKKILEKCPRVRIFPRLIEYKINGIDIVMCHYPMLVWKKSHYGSIMLHSHAHNGSDNMETRRFNVGADLMGFRPKSFDEILGEVKNRKPMLFKDIYNIGEFVQR